jgi:hypothetical protein
VRQVNWKPTTKTSFSFRSLSQVYCFEGLQTHSLALLALLIQTVTVYTRSKYYVTTRSATWSGVIFMLICMKILCLSGQIIRYPDVVITQICLFSWATGRKERYKNVWGGGGSASSKDRMLELINELIDQNVAHGTDICPHLFPVMPDFIRR